MLNRLRGGLWYRRAGVRYVNMRKQFSEAASAEQQISTAEFCTFGAF